MADVETTASEAAQSSEQRARIQRQRRTVGLGILTAAAVAFLTWMGLFDRLDLMALDALFRWRGPEARPDELVVVAVDETSMQEIGQRWPWRRDVHARLIDALSEAGARLIAFDIYFGDPSENPDDDIALAQAIERAGNVIVVNRAEAQEAESFRALSLRNPIRPLIEAGAILGFANMPFDSDGFIRRSHPVAWWGGQRHISFPLAIYLASRGLSEEAVSAPLGGRTVQAGDLTIPVAEDGSYLIRYLGPARTVRTLSYYQVLGGLAPASWLEDRIVLIGATDETLHDTFQTPFGGAPMPGVEVHAHALATMMQGRFIRPAPEAGSIVALLVLAAALSVAFSRLGAVAGLVLTGGAAAAVIVVSASLFTGLDIWVSPIAPLIAVGAVFSVTAAYRFVTEEAERRRVRNIFGRYVSPEVMQEIVDSGVEIRLGGRRQKVTILFTDIRGFTTFSEQLSPEEVVARLNEYFEVMTEIIFRHGGTVDKYVGDCIMVLFGAPIARPDDAKRCVQAALEMRAALGELKKRWKEEGKIPFDTGIGIHTGEAIVGNIGSQRRMEYTVIGDAVNIAARIESLTKDYEAPILISEATYEDLDSSIAVERIGETPIRGRKTAVALYRVVEPHSAPQAG